MIKVLIPTRNRPASLLSVVRFLERFYPGTELIVADGSSAEHGEVNAGNLKNASLKVGVEYRKYPYEMPLFDRILDALSRIDDDYLVMGSDDDYPLMDGLLRVFKKLKDDPDAATGLGATLHFTLKPGNDLTARLGFARPLLAPVSDARARNFSIWPFSTTYAVTRRELLIERFNRSREVFLSDFYDFGVGLHDAFFGKMLAVPEFAYIAARNFNHSYLRPDDPFLFVRRSEDFFKLKDYIEGDLVKYAGMPEKESVEMATHLLLRRVAGLAGAPPQRLRGFESSRVFSNPMVQRQYALFGDVFKQGTDARATYEERLRFIVDAVQSVSSSQDNKGEPTTVESLDSQTRASCPKDAASPTENQMFKPAHTRKKSVFAVPNLVLSIDPDTLLNRDSNVPRDIHILALGQANISDSGGTKEISQFGSTLFSDGQTQDMEPPIAGGAGEQGSVWPRLAKQIVAQNAADRFVVSLRVADETSIADWSSGGAQYQALEKDLEKYSEIEPQVTHVLWYQGERDTLLKTGQKDYEKRFAALFNMVSKKLPDVKWIVCRASYRMGETSSDVVDAQTRIIADYSSCHAGPNTDLLGERFRRDNIHFNDNGLSEFARMLLNAIILADA